jgi:hypothetical protein
MSAFSELEPPVQLEEEELLGLDPLTAAGSQQLPLSRASSRGSVYYTPNPSPPPPPVLNSAEAEQDSEGGYATAKADIAHR